MIVQVETLNYCSLRYICQPLQPFEVLIGLNASGKSTFLAVILSLSDPRNVLCFGRDASGATDIVRGIDHPRLASWRHETDLGTLFAAGVLG